jgi:hypothetical protein
MDYCDFLTASWTPGPLPETADHLFDGDWGDIPQILRKAGRPRTAKPADAGRSLKREGVTK